jgi:hypothetical protein
MVANQKVEFTAVCFFFFVLIHGLAAMKERIGLGLALTVGAAVQFERR